MNLMIFWISYCFSANQITEFFVDNISSGTWKISLVFNKKKAHIRDNYTPVGFQ